MTPPTPHPTPGALQGRRGAGHRPRGDAGSASIELAIVFPVLLAVVTAIVQYGLWFHARSLALAAAQEGAVTAATYDAPPGSGADRARAFLAAHANDTLTRIQIEQSTPAPGHVSVQVTGQALSLLPGVAGLAVTQSAQAPLERFTVADGP